MYPDEPDPVEIAILESEMHYERKRRVRELMNSMTPEEWVKRWDFQNAQSIARGDGDLPF